MLPADEWLLYARERSKPSPVAKYVQALGGELKISAVFGDTTYTLLDDVHEPEPVKPRSRSRA
jgi:hypothetical protein